MDDPTLAIAHMLERLERVERQNRSWRGISLLAVLVLGIVVLAGGAEPPKDVVIARDFKLTDSHGKVRGRLFMTGLGQPALALYDETGKERANVHIAKDGPRFCCLDSNAIHSLAVLGGNEKGGYSNLWTASNKSTFSASYDTMRISRNLVLDDEQGRPRLFCGLDSEGSPSFALVAPNGVNRANLTLNPGGPAMTIYDSSGKIMLMQTGAVPKGGFLIGRNDGNEVIFGLDNNGLSVKE